MFMFAEQSHAKVLRSVTPFTTLKGVKLQTSDVILAIDQAIEGYEREVKRLRDARAQLVADASFEADADKSIGQVLMDALKTGPKTVKQIHQLVAAKGKIAQYHTVSSMVNYYFRRKYIKRVGKGTYALAEKSDVSKLAHE